MKICFKMWIYKNKNIKSIKDVPKKAIGFIYEIEDEQGKKYIGRKSLYSLRKPEIAKSTYERLKKEGEPVTRTKNKKKSKPGSPVWRYKKIVEGETNWLTYTGSSKELNSKIKKGSKITKRILKFCYNKKQLSYYETKYQMCLGVIEENSENYYNGNILGKFFKKDLENE